ncbi:small integral membrane protein 24-like [Chiloscyllium plagiosum]|uniref:small integral membrane protein 24-like n=1 Tax=Chiloscyllium plagiosum TaxID=36176 RepID=UPI001CB874E8|nr:small integral membrane protein 24-like [Chiloscyllium plagiosum]
MAFHCRVLIALLLLYLNAQAGAAKTTSSGAWQPWLIGLTAVTVFIFIVFVLLIMNRIFCTKNKNQGDSDNNHSGGDECVKQDIELLPEDRNKNQKDSDSNHSGDDGTAASNEYCNPAIIEDEKRTNL